MPPRDLVDFAHIALRHQTLALDMAELKYHASPSDFGLRDGMERPAHLHAPDFCAVAEEAETKIRGGSTSSFIHGSA